MSQVCAFSATFPAASDPLLQLWLGDDSESLSFVTDAQWVSPHITQIVHVCAEHKKMIKLKKHLIKIDAENPDRPRPRILIFANTIKKVRSIHKELEADHRTVMLHGKRTPSERIEAMNSFRSASRHCPSILRVSRSGKVEILVATDVAGRGLDIKNLPYVVNYDFPTRLETYIHRIGRTGRLASDGHAYGFFTRNLAPMAADLIQLLQHHNQWIDPNLRTLAQSYQEAQKFLQKIQDIENDQLPSPTDQSKDSLGNQKQKPKSTTEYSSEAIQKTEHALLTSPQSVSSEEDNSSPVENDIDHASDGHLDGLLDDDTAEHPSTAAVLDGLDAVSGSKPSKRQSSRVPVFARKKRRS